MASQDRTSLGQSADARFTVRGKLGAGGMGVVYRVWDRVHGTEVALKVLRNATGHDLYRFKREFRALSDIAHPNLATLHELQVAGDEWFFTMELVEGASFLEWVRPHQLRPDRDGAGEDGTTRSSHSSRPPPATPPAVGAPADLRQRIIAAAVDLERLDDALYQLCDGVHALHLVGKLHRDLKPSNVKVDAHGRVVLLDFGLVLERDAVHADITHETAIVGTPTYMSPEQAADLPLGDGSDWYSVGVMLYEALTGQRPFEGSSPEQMLSRKRSETPAPPSRYAAVPAALEALCMRLLARDPAARPRGEEILAVLGRAPSRHTVALYAAHTAGPFVGRADERAALAGAAAASQGGCVVQLVRGRSGIGKSALLHQALDDIGRDPRAVVLHGRCYERESLPYKALDTVIDALTAHLIRMPPAEIDAILPRGMAALVRLFPVLRRVSALGDASHRWSVPPDPIELRRRAFDALRYLLRKLAETRPVVVAIDDLQWGDADSAAFLADLVYHPEPPALLLLACYRSEDEATSQIVRQLLDRGPGHADVRALTVPALDEPAARELIAQLATDAGADRAEAILREADGSPFFLAELARAGGDGRAGLDDVVVARVQRLPREAQALLAVCAVAARPLPAGLALRAAGLEREGNTLALLRAERLLRLRHGGGEARLEPYHDRIREAVVSAMPVAELRAWHVALAQAIEAEPEPDREALVEHWMAIGEVRRAAAAARVAADAAVEALAFHRAATLYQLALTHGELDAEARRATLVRLAEVLAHAGRLDDAAATFAQAADGAGEAERRDLKRRELEQVLRAGHVARGVEESRALLAHVGVRLPRTNRGAIATILYERLRLRLRGLTFRSRSSTDVSPDVLARIDLAWSLVSGLTFAQPILGKALQMRLLRDALKVGEPRRVATALTLEIGQRSMVGVRARAATEAVVAQSRALAEKIGEPYRIGVIDGSAGVASYLVGQFREAKERLERAERFLRDRCIDIRWELDVVELFRCAALWYLGETRELARLVPIYLGEAIERGDRYAERGLRTWRSNCAWLVLGRPDEARAHAVAADIPGGLEGFHLHHYYQLLAHAQIDLYVGAAEAAGARVEAAWRDLERSMLRRIETVHIETSYLRARCALAIAAAGAPTSARFRLARRLARDIERTGAPWAAPLAASVRAQVAALTGDPVVAAAQLRAAIAGFAAVDMKLYAAAAQRRLAAVADDPAAGAAGDAFMAEQAIADPPAMTRMLLPGFPR